MRDNKLIRISVKNQDHTRCLIMESILVSLLMSYLYALNAIKTIKRNVMLGKMHTKSVVSQATML